MTITTRITLREYVKLLMGRAYHKPVMLVIVSVGAIMAFWILGYHMGISALPKPQFYQYTTLALITVVQPTALFLIMRKTYKSSGHLQEQVEMKFTAERIELHGSTFLTEFLWTTVFKVVELPDWYMIYHNSLSAVLVPKRSFSAGQEDEFRSLLRSLRRDQLHLRPHDLS